MPAYLCHGFRWHRKSIRYFVVLRDVDDAAPEWIVAPRSAEAILDVLCELFEFVPPSAPPRYGSPPESRGMTDVVPNYSPTDSLAKRALEYQQEKEDEEVTRGRRHADAPGSILRAISRKRTKSTTRLRKSDRHPQTSPLPPTKLPLPPPLPPESDRNVSFNDWSSVKFLEEYDPLNEAVLNGPWAYVADHVVRIDNSISPIEEMLRYEEQTRFDKVRAMSGPSDETGRKVSSKGSKKAGWLEKLRDNLQREEDIRWYVVICGDEERSYSQNYGDEDEEDDEDVIDDGSLANPFEFRLPEFANPGVKPLEVPPLRLRKQDRLQSPLEQRKRAVNDDLPPAVPEKDFPRYTPPPPPLENLNGLGRKSSMDQAIRVKSQKSTTGLRKLFSKRQIENPV